MLDKYDNQVLYDKEMKQFTSLTAIGDELEEEKFSEKKFLETQEKK